MRKAVSVVALVAVVALVLGVAAQAAGNGATKADLLIGYYPDGGHSEIADPPTAVGDVIFNATGNGMMQVTVSLQDGAPDTTFQVFLVPQATWGTLVEQGLLTMTTNGKGKASIHLARPIPETLGENDYFKVVVRHVPDLVYVTDRYDIETKK